VKEAKEGKRGMVGKIEIFKKKGGKKKNKRDVLGLPGGEGGRKNFFEKKKTVKEHVRQLQKKKGEGKRDQVGTVSRRGRG